MGILVSGCATNHVSRSQETLVVDEVLAVGPKGPRQGEDAVYLILAAELAGERGQYEVALDNYLKAAALTQDVKVAQRATQIALYLKKNDKALEAALQWQKREPGSTEAKRLTAMLLLKAGREDEALDLLTELLNTPKLEMENTLVDVAKLLSTETDKQASLDFMRQIGERFPRKAEPHFATALLASEQGDFATALAEANKALALRPDWSKARLLRAQIMAKQGDSHETRGAIQHALKTDPNNAKLRLANAQYLAKSGDLRGAEKELLKILARDPQNEDARLGLAMAQLELGKEAAARQSLERLTESPSRKMQAYFYLGLLDARKKSYQTALEWFDKVTEGPVSFEAKVNAISSLLNMGEIPEARIRLGDVRRQYPQEAVRLYLLEAELLSKNQTFDDAYQLLNQAVAEMPGQVDLLYSRALVAEQLGKGDILEADLRAVLAKQPEDPNALNALGFTLADHAERLEEAKGYISRALAIKPDEPAYLDSYGWVSYRLGDLPAALEYLGRAYALTKNPEIGAHYGEVLWESGKQKEAKQVWQECLRKDPSHRDIKKVMARYPQAFN